MIQRLKNLYYFLIDKLLRPYMNFYFRKSVFSFGSDFENYLRKFLTYRYLVFGDPARLSIAATADLNNAILNVVSGKIIIEDYVFFGHHVSILTGTHDENKTNLDRQRAIPTEGRDIIIHQGAWIASNATIIGPCEIGEHAVIAAGAVVVEDVPPHSVVAGVPAKVVKHIDIDGTSSQFVSRRKETK